MKKTAILTLLVSALLTGCLATEDVNSGDYQLSDREYQANVHTIIRNLGIDGYACELDARGTKACVVEARSGEVLSCSSEIELSTELEVCANGNCGPLTAAYECEGDDCFCDGLIDCILMNKEMCAEGTLECDQDGCTCSI
jgi:hypothetical protein